MNEHFNWQLLKQRRNKQRDGNDVPVSSAVCWCCVATAGPRDGRRFVFVLLSAVITLKATSYWIKFAPKWQKWVLGLTIRPILNDQTRPESLKRTPSLPERSWRSCRRRSRAHQSVCLITPMTPTAGPDQIRTSTPTGSGRVRGPGLPRLPGHIKPLRRRPETTGALNPAPGRSRPLLRRWAPGLRLALGMRRGWRACPGVELSCQVGWAVQVGWEGVALGLGSVRGGDRRPAPVGWPVEGPDPGRLGEEEAAVAEEEEGVPIPSRRKEPGITVRTNMKMLLDYSQRTQRPLNRYVAGWCQLTTIYSMLILILKYYTCSDSV